MSDERLKEVRVAIAKADDERRYADAAETAMRSIRLGYSPKVRERKRFWFGIHERAFTSAQTRVLYEALAIVRRTHEARAAEYDRAALTAEPEPEGAAGGGS